MIATQGIGGSMRAAVALFVVSTLASGFAGDTPDCHGLKLMARMARIVAWESSEVVATEMQRVCTSTGNVDTSTWPAPAKGNMKMALGTWYYPGKGGSAIRSQSLYYPGDGYAKVGETWYYPKGG